MSERLKADDRPSGSLPFYTPFSIPGIRQCVYFTDGQGGSFVGGEGHEEGLNYTEPVVTSAKIITRLAMTVYHRDIAL